MTRSPFDPPEPPDPHAPFVRSVVGGLLVFAVDAALLASLGHRGLHGLRNVSFALAMSLGASIVIATLAFALSSVVARLGDPERTARRLGAFAALVAGAAATILGYLLTEGRRVHDHALRYPAIAVGGLVAFVFAAIVVIVVSKLRSRSAGMRMTTAVLFVIAGVSLAVLDAMVLRRVYPALHIALALASIVSLLLASVVVPLHALASRYVTLVAMGVTGIALAGTPFLAAEILDRASMSFVVVEAAPFSGKILRTLRRTRPSIASPERLPVERPEPPPGDSRGIELESRDVLLVTVDALRYDRLRAYGGHGLTPAMDAIAAEGAVFDRAYTPTPHTSYALASLLTGSYAHALMALRAETGSASFDLPSPIALLMARAGYETAAFYPPAVFFVEGERLEALRQRHFGFAHVVAEFASGDQRVRQLSDFLAESPSGRPVFAWVHLFEPHEPYEPPADLARGDSLVERYDGEVRAADRAFGRLVEVFRAARPNATVILTADHGEELGDHGGYYHGTTLYDEQVRVPLLWSSPGSVPPSVIEAPVELVDVAPTLLTAIGVPPDGRMQGDDLGPVLSRSTSHPPVHAFAAIDDARMVTNGALKAICEMGVPQCRLYDLIADPREETDLGDDRPDDAASLSSALSAFYLELPRRASDRRAPDALLRMSLGDPHVAPDIVPLLGDADADVRAPAAAALGRLRFEAALPALRRLASEDPDPTVRDEAALAGVLLGDTPSIETAFATLARERGARPAARSDVASRIALALAHEGDARGEPELVAMIEDPNALLQYRRDAVERAGALRLEAAVTSLIALLGDLSLRTLAATALGRIGDARAASPLVRALSRETYAGARAAEAEALVRLGDRRAIPLVKEGLGAATPIDSGVRMLVEAGALAHESGEGADLRHAPRVRRGEWTCSVEGCSPGTGASIALPSSRAPRAPLRAIVRVVATRDGTLTLAGEERPVRAGTHEIAFEPAQGRELAMAATPGIVLVAIAVVPRR